MREVNDMLMAMSGRVKDGAIVVDESLAGYDGMNLVVTFLDDGEVAPFEQTTIDFSKYGHRTERGQHVEEYMEEMRGNDRL